MKRARVAVSVGASVSAAIIIILSLIATGYLQSVSSSIVATRENPLGIEARVAYVHQNSAYSCPVSPCDSSGFVLKVISKNGDAMFQGYDVCKAGGSLFASCVHSDDLAYSLKASREFPNDPHEWGNAIILQRNSDWKIGDVVDITVKVEAVALEQPMSGWIELDESPILEFINI